MKKFLNTKHVGAYILVVLGFVFLIDSLFGLDSGLAFRFLFKFWPLFLIVPGLMTILWDQDSGEKKESEEKNI